MSGRGTRGELRAEMLGVVVSIARGQLRGRHIGVRLSAAFRAIQVIDTTLDDGSEDTPLTADEARAVLAADPTIRSIVLAKPEIHTEVQ